MEGVRAGRAKRSEIRLSYFAIGHPTPVTVMVVPFETGDPIAAKEFVNGRVAGRRKSFGASTSSA